MARVKLIFWIVVYAVVLGLAVSYCIDKWMPQVVLDWILWGVATLLGLSAIVHIASFAKLLGKGEDK